MARANTVTGGRAATDAIIPGDICISVGNPGSFLPRDWKWTRLTDVARLESGHTPSRSKPEYWGGEIPWIGIRDATGNHGRTIFETNENTNALGIANSSARVLPKETVCLSRTASVGYVVVMGKPMSTSQDFVNWVCSDELNPNFLKYALLAEQRALHMYSVGSVHSTIYFPEVKAFHIALPGRSIQDGIVDVLSALDDKIELSRRTNETLEAMAQAIFKDWFVDFGPVRRKMQGETTPAAILGGLIDNPAKATTLAALFPDTLGDNSLPEGWVEEPIGDVCDTVGGATPPTKTAEYWENGKHFWATPKDLSNLSGLYVRTTERSISDEGLVRISSGLSPKGSILMSSRAPIGYVAIASVPVAVNQGFIVMRATERMPTEYAYFWTKANMDLIESNANGSTFQEISKKNFRPLPVIMPDAQIMLAFVNLTKQMLGRIEQGEIENQTLAEIRDYLLPKLMSGQIQAGGIAEKAAMDGTMNDNVMSLFPDLDTQESEQKLQDAVLVACVVHALQTDDLVVGNVRYQKGVYFLRRLTGAVMPTTTKMAAGPYDAHLAHHGGFQEALGLGYIKRRKNGQFEGTVPGHAIAAARKLAREAGLSDAINWVAENLRGKSREELEVLATVDFAMRELVASGKLITAQTIREDIKSDPTWRSKLGKRHFMGNAIPSAIAELRQWFPNDYNTT